MDERYMEHLQLLAERNRLRAELAQRTSSREQATRREREAGFDVFLSGANAPRVQVRTGAPFVP